MTSSLRYRLALIYICSAIGPLIIVSFLAGWFGFINLKQESLSKQQEITKLIANEISVFFKDRQEEILILDRLSGFGKESLKEQRRVLSIFLQHQKIYQKLLLLDALGQKRFSLSRTGFDLSTLALSGP